MMNDQIEEKIINATVDYIREHGYQTISLRKISQAAGVTTGAFYNHFKNKETLLYQTAVILSTQLIAEISGSQEKPAFDQLLHIAQRFCQEFQRQPQVMDFLFFNPTVIKVYQGPNDDFPFLRTVQHLAHQVNPGLLSDQRFFAQLWAFIQGYSLLIKNRVTDYDPQLVKTTLNQFVGGQD